MRVLRVWVSILILLTVGGAAGCSRSRPHARTTGGPAAPTETTEPTVAIPEGRLLVGSVPGTAGRVAAREADRVPITVAEFEIDRLPFPGRAPFRTGVTRVEAAALCEREGKRLCAELEWERACSGDATSTYPNGETFDAAACTNASCASALGVASLGTLHGEWTSSDASVDGRPMAVVRGASSTNAADHRCATRHLVSPQAVDAAIGFRCCEGDSPSVSYPIEPAVPVAVRFTPTTEELRAALSSVHELSRFAGDFRPFRREEQQDVLTRGANANTPVVIPEARVVRSALRWTPAPGDTVWVFAGRSGTTTIIAVLYPLGDGSFAHAASLVMPHDASVAIITTRESEPKTLGFSTCLSCGGEDGEIRLRDDGRFDVVTR